MTTIKLLMILVSALQLYFIAVKEDDVFTQSDFFHILIDTFLLFCFNAFCVTLLATLFGVRVTQNAGVFLSVCALIIIGYTSFYFGRNYLEHKPLLRVKVSTVITTLIITGISSGLVITCVSNI